MTELSDQDILSRLTSFEDAFVERKSTGDIRDLLKSAVAFANSNPIGWPSILFYGVTDKGEPEGKANLDSLQKTVSERLADAYPPIYYLTKVLEQNGKQFLAVIIPGSDNRPHFAGQSYVRDGTQTRQASGRQFEQLVAERNSVVYEILKWKGKQITLQTQASEFDPYSAYLNDCNRHYVTFQVQRKDEPTTLTHSLPLSQVTVCFDQKAKRLSLIVKGWEVPTTPRVTVI